MGDGSCGRWFAATLLIAAAAAAMPESRAEPSAFSGATTKPVPVDRVLERPRATVLPMTEQVVLTRQATDEARALYRRGFQLRIFRVDSAQGLPVALAGFEPCYVYLSYVMQVDGSYGVEVSLGAFDNLNWLDVREGRPPDRGHFLLVIEERGDNASLFRLDRNSTKTYFESGLYVDIVPTRSFTADQVRSYVEAAARYWADVVEQARRNERQFHCYRVAERPASDRDELMAYVEPCIEDPGDLRAVQ